MLPSTQGNRQMSLEQIMEEALKDKNLKEALAAYEMGQVEYKRAIDASVTVEICSGTTSNPISKGN